MFTIRNILHNQYTNIMKTISLTVNLTFSDDVSDDNLIKEVAGNVLDALVNYVNECGLAPADSDSYTQKIEVKEQFTETDLSWGE